MLFFVREVKGVVGGSKDTLFEIGRLKIIEMPEMKM